MAGVQVIAYGYCHCGCGAKTPIARKTRNPIGHKKGQPIQYVRGHNTRLSPVEYIVDPAGCWVWQRHRTPDGYGKITVPGRGSVSAHRYYYEQNVGPIPTGLQVDHLCRNRACVNPAHLEAVTPKVNSNRSARTKLTDVDVVEVRRSATSEDGALAERFGVTRAHVRAVRAGRQRGAGHAA